MQYVTYSALSYLILGFCGLPFAIWLLPRDLARVALPSAPLFGYAYIVFVGYHVFRTNIGGSDLFAPYLLIVPALALGLAWWRGRLKPSILLGRESLIMVGLSALAFVVVSALFLLARGRAVSLALSNLDIVELAAVARYMQELARDTTIGFLGQSGHFRWTADDIWFGPSMIVAVISSLIGSEPFRLQSIVISIVACQGPAFVYAIARDSLSLNRETSLVVGILCAISPVLVYVIWQAFGGQMISVSLMLMVTYLITRAQTEPATLRTQLRYLPAIVLMFSALLVTYHFMIAIICFLLGLYVTIFALTERSWRRLWLGAAVLTAAAVLSLLLNPMRVPGVINTISMIKDSNNGWFIPWFSPDVQLGFNVSWLMTGTGPSVQLLGVSVVIGLAIATALHLMRERPPRLHLAFVLGLAVPAFLLGLFYAIQEAGHGTLGSYRSFKITATFTAFTLLALSLWFGVQRMNKRSRSMFIGAALTSVLVIAAVINNVAMIRFGRAHVYVPSEELTQIRKIESMDFVSGINIMSDENFDVFWTHYFTLKKRQVFQTFPYGGRNVAALVEPYRLEPVRSGAGVRGWGGIFVVESVGCIEEFLITQRLVLCKPTTNTDVVLTPGAGWWDREPTLHWSGRKGRIADVNIDNRTVGTRVRIRAMFGELRPNNAITLSVDGEAVSVESTRVQIVSAPFELKTGRNVARFTTALDPAPPSAWDGRTLGVLWKQIAIEFPDLPTRTSK